MNRRDRGDILVLQSANGGTSWAANAFRVNADGSAGNWSTNDVFIGDSDSWMPQMVIGTDHVAYLAWVERGAQLSLQTCAVTNRGTGVGPTYTIRTLTTTVSPMHLMRSNTTTNADDYFKAFNYPALAVNPGANGTNRSKHLYVAYADKGTNANDRADIFFLQSTNGGANWGTNAPVRVSADSTTNDQWMPTIAVRPDGNQLFIGWLDRRNDTNNSLIDAYGRWGTIATNGAVTFFTNDFRITTQSFPPAFSGTLVVNTNQGYYDPVWPPADMALDWWYDWWFIDPDTGPDKTDFTYRSEAGEHMGAWADASCVYLVWSDNRSGSQQTAHPGRKQADIRFGRLPWAWP